MVLDLNTTNLGPVVSDLRFSPGKLDIRMVAADEGAVSVLESEADGLMDVLKEKGFKPVLDIRAVIPGDEGISRFVPVPPIQSASPEPGQAHLDVEA